VSGAPGAPAPLRVALLSAEYPPTRGGVGDYTACLARALARQAARCSVVTTHLPGVRRPRRPFDPDVCPAIRRWGWSSLSHLRALLRDLQPDVVHLQYQTGAFGMHPAVNLLPLALRAAGSRAPFVVTFHDLKEPYLFRGAGPLRPLPNALLRRFADAVVVTNEQDFARAAGPKVRQIPIGSNIDPVALGPSDRAEARARLGLRDELAIGYFGFVNEWKGVDTLVDAFGQLLAQGRDARLVFVGGARREGASASFGFEAAIRRRLEAEPFRGNVVWTGFGEPDEISRFLQALDVCALPFVEGASYRHGTLAAALAHGRTIVTTHPPPAEGCGGVDTSRLDALVPVRTVADRSGNGAVCAEGLPRLVDRQNARLVPPRDPQALAAALGELADDPALRARIADGAARLAPRFGWDGIARDTRALYDALLGRAVAPSAPTPLAVPG
jgi:glycosyltransferase involved in cell wall biosynthesis